jgi:glycosyltransferase involved in cell wall biosynthesis
MRSISVIIPTYQHAGSIVKCLESLFAQTRLPDEIIVVDDGSTDNTQDRLARFESKITYIAQNNEGAPSARMRGFGASTGALVLFCDADVLLARNALEKLEQALDLNPGASYAYSSFAWGTKKFSSRPFDARELQKGNFIHTTALIRREHFPGFDIDLKRFQDWDLWLTMFEQGHIGVFVNEELFSVTQERGRKNISRWLPSFVYNIPWQKIGWAPRAVREYLNSKKIVFKKHHLL